MNQLWKLQPILLWMLVCVLALLLHSYSSGRLDLLLEHFGKNQQQFKVHAGTYALIGLIAGAVIGTPAVFLRTSINRVLASTWDDGWRASDAFLDALYFVTWAALFGVLKLSMLYLVPLALFFVALSYLFLVQRVYSELPAAKKATWVLLTVSYLFVLPIAGFLAFSHSVGWAMRLMRVLPI